MYNGWIPLYLQEEQIHILNILSSQEIEVLDNGMGGYKKPISIPILLSLCMFNDPSTTTTKYNFQLLNTKVTDSLGGNSSAMCFQWKHVFPPYLTYSWCNKQILECSGCHMAVLHIEYSNIVYISTDNYSDSIWATTYSEKGKIIGYGTILVPKRITSCLFRRTPFERKS